MRIAYISTSFPRECGLATFNFNLMGAIHGNDPISNNSFVVALSDTESLKYYKFPKAVKFIIRQENEQDYVRAADYINASQADACILEHEFGIFGGEYGSFILTLMARLTKPLISVLHTVLENPAPNQLIIIREVARYSAKTVVMSRKAIGFLTSLYHIPVNKIKFIEHGVPDLEKGHFNPVKSAFPFKNKRVLFTFGLMSRNKGLETVIYALPEILRQHSDVVYMVLGNTHPGVLRNSGEEYRDSLKDLAKELNVEQHIIFINKFVSETELFNYLTAADIYITPYLNESQITSGTLSYAVGAGSAVLSTPYWHARELLAFGRGELFNFKDSDRLAFLVNDLLQNESKLLQLKKNAYRYGLKLRWPYIGKIYADVLKEAILGAGKMQEKTAVAREDHIERYGSSPASKQLANGAF